MLRISVTGGVACGKSLVGAQLTRAGVPVCEADRLAHELMEPSQPVYQAVVQAFGEGILADDGRIDRRRLGRLVFADAAQLARLNGMVHPSVKRAWRKWLSEQDAAGRRAAAVIIPLLYEVGGEVDNWDVVVCVTAPEAIQLRRLRERGHTEMESRQRIAAQMDVRQKAARADYVIENTGSIELLERQTKRMLEHIVEKDYGAEE